MMKRHKPKETKGELKNVLFVRVDDLMLSELKEIASAEDRDISYLIRKAIEKFIEGYSKKK